MTNQESNSTAYTNSGVQQANTNPGVQENTNPVVQQAYTYPGVQQAYAYHGVELVQKVSSHQTIRWKQTIASSYKLALTNSLLKRRVFHAKRTEAALRALRRVHKATISVKDECACLAFGMALGAAAAIVLRFFAILVT